MTGPAVPREAWAMPHIKTNLPWQGRGTKMVSQVVHLLLAATGLLLGYL